MHIPKKNWAHLCVCVSVCDFSVCDCLSLTVSVSVWVLFTTHCLLTARTVRTATNCRRIRRRSWRSSRRRRNSRRRHAQGNLFSWLELLTKLFSCAFFDTFFPTLFQCVRFLCGRALRRSLANWKTKSKTKSQLEMATPAAQQRSPNYPTSPFSHSLSLSLWRACAQLKTDSMRLRSCGEIRGGVVGQWRGQLLVWGGGKGAMHWGPTAAALGPVSWHHKWPIASCLSHSFAESSRGRTCLPARSRHTHTNTLRIWSEMLSLLLNKRVSSHAAKKCVCPHDICGSTMPMTSLVSSVYGGKTVRIKVCFATIEIPCKWQIKLFLNIKQDR